MTALFDGVCALNDRNPVAGVHLRTRPRLESVLREHLAELCGRVPLLPGAGGLILLRGESVGEDAWTPVRYPGGGVRSRRTVAQHYWVLNTAAATTI